jgi:hypothetical protein
MDPAKPPVALLIASDNDALTTTLRLDAKRLCCFCDDAKVEGTEPKAKYAGRPVDPTLRYVVM